VIHTQSLQEYETSSIMHVYVEPCTVWSGISKC